MVLCLIQNSPRPRNFGKSVYHFAITHIIAFDPTMGQSIEPDQTYKTVINSFVWDPFWVLTLTKV
jgi:hypothetical protein